MRISMAANDASRSFLRGGRYSVLAICCVTVGVMGVVTMQLVGLMVRNMPASALPDANGGDIVVISHNKPFKTGALSFFEQLKNNGVITSYTALITASGSIRLSALSTSAFRVEAIDPSSFPVVTLPSFAKRTSSTFSILLTHDSSKQTPVIVTQAFVAASKTRLGETFAVYAGNTDGQGRVLYVRIVGIAANMGPFALAGRTLLIAIQDYVAANPHEPIFYDTVNIATTDQAHTDQTVKAIQRQFPFSSTQSAVKLIARQDSLEKLNHVLEIAGLLILLISGVGFASIIRVILSRRTMEIAALKAMGYRRKDLYLRLTGEVGFLGLLGGMVGAAIAIGTSALIRNLIQQAFQVSIPFLLDARVIGAGVPIGLAVAVLFGLLPMMLVANTCPRQVNVYIP
jgi:putative ABC transport system permease protein